MRPSNADLQGCLGAYCRVIDQAKAAKTGLVTYMPLANHAAPKARQPHSGFDPRQAVAVLFTSAATPSLREPRLSALDKFPHNPQTKGCHAR